MADLEGLLALERRCFAGNEGLFNRRQVRYLLTSPRAAWLVAGDFAGAACCLRAGNGRQRWGRLYSLAVDPACRKQGIARALLDASFSWFRAQDIGLVRAEVKADNTAARTLYAAMGFSEAGRIVDYYGAGETAVKLIRRL